MSFREHLDNIVVTKINEEEYDLLRDKFGKQKQYSQKQIDSLHKGKKYRVGKVWYDVAFKDKDAAKALGMRWDKDMKMWYLNMYDKNLTWRTQSSFPKPKDLEAFFAPMNKRLKVKFKVKDFDFYNAK